ncbi:MAG: hypothetical protein FH749_05240 [Firmicutes bacterium]|nr:hypothetical protein [Bacillota bacterium]
MANGKQSMRWLRNILLWTFFLSLFFNIVSQSLLGWLGLIGSLLVLLAIILLGVVFDTIGTAAAVSSLPPLNAKAAKRLPGARQALSLAKNSEQVATFCNDVVGDISGIISGAAATAIIFQLATDNIIAESTYLSIILTALVASLTVGGKGIGKTLAINRAPDILMIAGRVIFYVQKLWPGKRGA